MASSSSESDVEKRKKLHVVGFAGDVDEATIRAAFIPFGEIADIVLPEGASKKRSSYAFVTFEDVDDAEAAIDNMHRAELGGRTIHVTVAKPQKMNLGSFHAIWDEAHSKENM